MTQAESLKAIEARLKHIEETQKEHSADLRKLLAAEAHREGIEAALRKEAEREYGDRWQVWVRSLLPIGVLTTFFTLVIEAARNFFENGGG